MWIPIIMLIVGVVMMAIGWDSLVSPGEELFGGLLLGVVGFLLFLFAIFFAIIGV
jgi:hypothetical protein